MPHQVKKATDGPKIHLPPTHLPPSTAKNITSAIPMPAVGQPALSIPAVGQTAEPQLQYLASLQGFKVQFTDFPKDGQFLRYRKMTQNDPKWPKRPKIAKFAISLLNSRRNSRQ